MRLQINSLSFFAQDLFFDIVSYPQTPLAKYHDNLFFLSNSSYKQYMIKQQNNRKIKKMISNQSKPKNTTTNHIYNQSNHIPQENLSNSINSVINYIANHKFSDAFAECNRLKFTHLQQITKIVYEYNHLKYVLLSKDKILQVNPQHNFLTESGMANIRTLALYRQQASQAKLAYQTIADNIKHIINSSSNFYKCSLPNRQQFIQIKNTLNLLFQEVKNMKKQKMMSYSQTTDKQKGKENTVVSQCKQYLLDIINLIVPTQILRKSANRQKTLTQLSFIAKSHIKQAFIGYTTQIQLLQSKAKICQNTLQSQRMVKMEKEQQIQSLKIQLIHSQQLIQDLQGIKAVTQMENLGLHSRIRTTQSDQEKELYEHQIQKLRQQIEDLSKHNIQLQQKYRFQIEQYKQSHQYKIHQLNFRLQQNQKQLMNDHQSIKQQLQHKNQTLKQKINQQKNNILQLQNQLTFMRQRQKQLIKQHHSAKEQKQKNQIQYQSIQQKYQQCINQIRRLQEEIYSYQHQISKLENQFTHSQEKIKSANTQIEELLKTLLDNEHQKHRLTQSLQICSSQNMNYCNMISLLEQKLKQTQDQLQYISAEKNYYYQYVNKINTIPQSQNIPT